MTNSPGRVDFWQGLLIAFGLAFALYILFGTAYVVLF